MQKRPRHKHYGGWWEVPGGKVEPGELPADALVRELHEELGVRIEPAALLPTMFATGPREDRPGALVILLYTVAAWDGVPRACEPGAEIAWFETEDLAGLRLPPLDIIMCEALVRAG